MDKRKSMIGVFLIFLGLITALGNLNVVKDLVILPVISIVFLFLYFYFGAWKRRGNIGFLIPGVIVGIVGIFAILDEGGYISPEMDPLFLIMLGAGFLLIMFIHTMRIDTPVWGAKYWPIFPGGILALIGMIALMTDENNTVMGLTGPAVLILIGVYVLLKPMLRAGSKDRDKKKEL